MDDNSSNSNTTAQRKRFHDPAPQSFPLQVSSRSLSPSSPSNQTSQTMFALGDAFQPLSSQYLKKDARPPSKLSSNSLLGSWSEDGIMDEANNDIFMNNLFHAELKLSRQKKTDSKGTTKSKPLSTMPGSNQHPKLQASSKVGTELEQLSSSPNPVVLLKETKTSGLTQDFNVSPSPKEMLASKDKTKKSRKKNQKDGGPKKKQKRKACANRKPKFPVLQKEPPIEEQIIALPVIALAPSLLASIVTDDPRSQSSINPFTTGGNSSRQTNMTMNRQNRTVSDPYASANYNHNSDDDVAPTQTFRGLLKNRGHDDMYAIDLEGTEYDVVPSPLQLASYGTYVVWAVLSSDPSLIRKLLGCGISPNPCNQFRDSILGDLVCKQGNFPIYKCFVDEFDADLRVVDGFGRTLLHHCCWAQDLCRPMVEDILQRDPIQIFLRDKQGKTPLEYVREDGFGTWNTFLNDVADKYWSRDSKLPQFAFPASARRLPNGDLMDPPDALTPALAAGVASGKITPQAVVTMSDVSRKTKGKQ
uniref:Uncharacterized protein n=1 Tax=Pseudo-nitzschia delicatissima TaxID=44447 RepID=A0A7S0XL50_9STRA